MSVTLTGWHISDSKRELQKFELSFITVPAKGYAVLSCSGSISDAAPTVAPFSVSGSGDGLILTSADGTVIDYFETGATRLGVTSGRPAAGAVTAFFLRRRPRAAQTPMFATFPMRRTPFFQIPNFITASLSRLR